MGLWSVMPTSMLTAINDAGAYYYACYLSINIGRFSNFLLFYKLTSATYVPAAIFCGVVAQKSPKVSEFARRIAQRRLEAAKTATWRPKGRQKRWTKLIKKADDENRRFWFGFSLGSFYKIAPNWISVIFRLSNERNNTHASWTYHSRSTDCPI